MTDRDKRMLIVLAVVAGLGGLYLLMKVVGGGGGGTSALPTGPTATGPPPVSPSPTGGGGHKPPVDLSGTRNPFSVPPGLAVGPAPSGATGATGATGVSGATGATGGTGPTSSPPPTSPPASSPPPTTPPPTTPPPRPGPSTTIGHHRVRLEDVFAHQTKVKVMVDGKLYIVEEGGRFAGNFELSKILGARCARFLYGDDAFELCL